jgi:hypothetical protein
LRGGEFGQPAFSRSDHAGSDLFLRSIISSIFLERPGAEEFV